MTVGGLKWSFANVLDVFPLGLLFFTINVCQLGDYVFTFVIMKLLRGFSFYVVLDLDKLFC